MNNEAQALIVRLLTRPFIPRTDKAARRVLTDELFREEVDLKLKECGLELLENPYSKFISIALRKEAESVAFESDSGWASNNMGLRRDALALLVIIWCKIILPKRERQVRRIEKDDGGQIDAFVSDKVILHGEEVSETIKESSIYTDYGKLLGGKTAIKNFMLSPLKKLGFIERRNGIISEGPLLDLALDYAEIAPRIRDGALAEILLAEQAVQYADDAKKEIADV